MSLKKSIQYFKNQNKMKTSKIKNKNVVKNKQIICLIPCDTVADHPRHI